MSSEVTPAPLALDRKHPWFVQPTPIRDLSRILRVSVDRLAEIAEENGIALPSNRNKMIPRPAVDRLVELSLPEREAAFLAVADA